MKEENKNSDEFAKLLDQNELNIPQIGEIVKGRVITASKAEVILDINGIMMGVVRGPELYNEVEEYSSLQAGDEIEAMVIDEENETGKLELSFRLVGQEKTWNNLRQAHKEKEVIKVRVVDANRGGLISRYRQIDGFLPVSQLAPENYPRISGGDKTKILEKLKSYVGQEFQVTVITLNEEDNKIIFSEKEVWNREQRPILDKYQVGTQVEGRITAITNFGVFISFDGGVEGLIHISELAWQRIDAPNEMYKVGDSIKAEIISLEGSKVFLSAKRLIPDPWLEASAKYQVGQIVDGTILKVNPFGLFVKLDEEIHGLAHISLLKVDAKQKISELYQADEVRKFEIVSISPAEHRLGLRLAEEEKSEETKETKKKEIKKEEVKEVKKETTQDEPNQEKVQEEKVAKQKKKEVQKPIQEKKTTTVKDKKKVAKEK
ncbi:MAG: 30S ribosomal protein S1 [Patescibacteria group bacterium]